MPESRSCCGAGRDAALSRAGHGVQHRNLPILPLLLLSLMLTATETHCCLVGPLPPCPLCCCAQDVCQGLACA
jgi:hypothetical protein